MSPKNAILTTGLTVLGVLGIAATRAATPGDPPAASGPSPVASAVSPPQTVLLKSNGQTLRGVITQEDGQFVVRQFGNAIRVPKDQAERTFESMVAVYRYKLGMIPGGDPDEHLKLARWCLTQNMPAEAKAELQAVVALSPTSREARAMLASVEASEARLTGRPRVDPALVQTRAEMVNEPPPAAPGAPAEIDPAFLKKATRELGVKGVPVIFALPPAVAAKRADQFARVVHPVLQSACARCHNENHDGAFRLVEVKSRRDLTATVLRANLDATLQLIDPESPAHSELLSSALLPHGKAPNKRPVFRGSNDPRFQILVAWVTSLRTAPAKASEGVVPARFGGEAPTPRASSGFASDRAQSPAGSSVSPAPLANPVKPYPLSGRTESMPPLRYVPGQGLVTETNPPAAEEFPVSPLVGGPMPSRNTPVGHASPATPKADPPVPGATRTAAPANLPALPPGLPPDDPAALPPARSKKPKTPVKIDPELLEKALRSRNSAR